MIPFLTLVVGSTTGPEDRPRTSTAPAAASLRETFERGWDLLTTVTDVWASLGVITAIAIALPISLGTIASHGERIARRAETAAVPSLDDYARLTLLDGALTISTGIAMLTAVLTFMLGIDTVLDSRTGWVQPAFFYLMLAAVLIIEIGKLGAFPKFADRSRLLVKTTLARSVAGRRDRAGRVGQRKAARTLGIVLAIHCAGYLALAWPAGPMVLGKSLNVAVAGLLCIALLTTVAGLHLGIGDRPTAVMSVLMGSFIGMFWVGILLSAASELRTYPVNPWGVMVGAWLFAPLYLLITLGLIGTGPLSRLAYYSLGIDDVLSGWDRALLARARRRLALEPTVSGSDNQAAMAPDDATQQPDGRRLPASPPSPADARTTAHTDHPVAATTATTADDGLAPVPPCAEQAPDPAVEPQYPGGEGSSSPPDPTQAPALDGPEGRAKPPQRIDIDDS
ncbi:hypothetical protein ACH47X_08175 [Promicromonospora kroppenstedtii]|uniref:Uncharacterized protein n=1 Tax=Promicromonospora kroppenstedtii TaxID=440482 RepID=A0ABW7XH97_9MICO